MSVIIKTMTNLPEHCYDCPCHNGESGYCQADKEHKYSVDRPFWCPLLKMPDRKRGNMTKEEAKEVFLNRGYIEVDGVVIYDPYKWREAYIVISNWLEQIRWIPVSERLPEEREWYLAVFKEKDTDFQLIPRVTDYIGKGENKWRIIDEEGLCQEYRDILECIAWMPLPEPYEAEVRNKDADSN